jgi:hypothetical protein
MNAEENNWQEEWSLRRMNDKEVRRPGRVNEKGEWKLREKMIRKKEEPKKNE